jgi:hypothetical protein
MKKSLKMPPPCGVESHVGRYKGWQRDSEDATPLRGGVSRWLLQEPRERCHALAGWQS